MDANGKCDDCGRFMRWDALGASTAVIYDMVAMEASYEHWRCPTCTERWGPVHSNAKPCDGDMSRYETHNALRSEEEK